MDQIIERMGRAISLAQRHLDDVSIETAMELGMSTIDLHNETGAVVTRSLLELGFMPTFYQFTDTTIDISVALSIRTGEDLHLGATVTVGTPIGGTGGTGGTGAAASPRPGAGPTGPTGPSGPAGQTTPGGAAGTQLIDRAAGSTVFGVTLTADYTRRYQFDSTAAAKVSTKMVAVPGPPAFLQALRTNFGVGAGA
jgi:hypothetical protein